jgi:cardiolipin synthase A/B
VWLFLLSAVLAVWAGIVAVVIVLQRRSAAATLAWVMTLIFLPVVGLLVYRIIGPLRLSRKKLKRENNRRVVSEALVALAEMGRDPDSTEHLQLARIGMAMGESSPLRAEEVEVFLDGDAKFKSILGAIAAATHQIHLEYYIWEPDKIGTRLRDALIERAKGGVKVRMIVDGTGAAGLKKRFLAPLRAAGVEVAWFNPIRLRLLRLRRPDFRTHRKIVVCDGRVGFTGGMNVADDHCKEYRDTYWRDTHVRLTGAAVWPLQRMFFEDWLFAAEQQLPVDATSFPTPEKAGSHLVQVLGSGPDGKTFPIHAAFFTAINQATDRAWLTTPYFVPDEAILAALMSAGLRDVDVRLIIPKRGDSRLVDMAARSYLPEVLAANVRVFEYEPRFIHAKTMLCDDDVAVIGTANLDNRSFRLNFECAAILFDGGVNGQLADAFAEDQKYCRELTLRDFEKQSLWTRLGQAGARLISPLL